MYQEIDKLGCFRVAAWQHRPFRHGFGLRDIPIQKYLPEMFVPETKQIHSDTIHFISRKKSSLLTGDAFITNEKGVVCSVRTADCVPILLADRDQNVVAAVHAGWKGTAARLVQKTVQKMVREMGCRPDNIEAAIGPAICGRCYLVQKDVVGFMEEAKLLPAEWCEAVNPKQWHLDLGQANLELLIHAGIAREQIYFSLACTFEDPARLSSYRREKEGRGEQVSFICL